MAKRVPPPEECANCGEDIPRNASACPGCGADERTGWREQSIYDGLDLPGGSDDETDGRAGNYAPTGVRWHWWLVALLLLLALGLGALGLRT